MTSPQRTLPWPLVETGWLAEHLPDSDLRILDCAVSMEMQDGVPQFMNGRDTWQEGHIPGSQHVDVLEELSDPNDPLPMTAPAPDQLAKIMGDLGVGEGTKVVLYDHSESAWAARVWWLLRVAGFENAAVLNGGWRKWSQEGREISTDATPSPSAEFKAKPNPALLADKDQVLAAINNPATALINALPAAIHSGEVNAYGRPGHIPNSSNVFCQTLVNPEDNTFLSVEELKNSFAHTKAQQAERVITYCGGGIAASGDALALTLLGLDNVAVYDGSLTEWAADPSLPLETG